MLDLRASGWNKSKLTNNPEGPMKIRDVAKKAARDGLGITVPKDVSERPKPADDEWATVGNMRKGNAKMPARSQPSVPTPPAAKANAFSAFSALQSSKKE